MRSIIFNVLMLFFYSTLNAVDLVDIPLSMVTNTRIDTAILTQKSIRMPQRAYLQQISKNYSTDTFRPYTASVKNKENEVVWYTHLHKKQTPYRVSLVGVNINSWLENPQYFETLQKQARGFSVQALLDNLQSYNPDLIFNHPLVVSKALKEDIYTPYLKSITNNKKIPLRFSDISNIVSYTRRYHIYGSAAGSLPYFGRPMEGAERSINLGILSGQLEEIAIKLPDTDIFLVAMINIIPNWLEEGWDIFHISQQELEILVYAFDRKGKVIGGAGVPMNFYQDGKDYSIQQKIRSKIWQEGVSRQFYMWPSFRMLNDRDKGASPRGVTISMPTDKRPTLNSNQRYILAAIKSLREQKKDTNIQLFTPDGKQTLKIKKSKNTQKILLTDRILQHKNSILMNNTNKQTQENVLALEELPLTVKLSKIAKNTAQSKEESKQKLFYPSNEGRKLESILAYGEEVLRKPIFTHTNELFYTNQVLTYELETDPVIYQREQKKYAIIPHNVKAYKKSFEKDTKRQVKSKLLQLKEKEYWNKYRIKLLKENSLYTDNIDQHYQEWKTIYEEYYKTSINLFKLNQDKKLQNQWNNLLPELKKRNVELIMSRYFEDSDKKDKALGKLEQRFENISAKIDTEIKDSTIDTKLKELNEIISALENNEKQKYDMLIKEIPRKFVNDISSKISNNSIIDMYKLSDYSKDDLEIIAYGLENKKKSPFIKMQDRNKRRMEKKVRWLSYEGFILGLTSNWFTRTRLIDRLDYL